MHPDLEDFLEAAFQSMEPTSPRVGRVVVEPEYDYAPSDSEQDAATLAKELTQILQNQSENSSQLSSHDGQEIEIPSQFKLLSQYVRRITLHGERAEGPWVEVAPPGNWI